MVFLCDVLSNHTSHDKVQKIEIGREKAFFLKCSPLYLLYREMTRIKSLALKEEGGCSWKEAASQVGLSLDPGQGDPMVEGRRGGGGWEGEGTSAAP